MRPVRSCTARPPREQAGPPDPAADVVGQRRHQQRAHHEGVEQHAERDDERDLRQEQDRDDRERRERRREHDAGRGDHAAGDGEAAQEPGLRARARPTPPAPGSSGRSSSRCPGRPGTRTRTAAIDGSAPGKPKTWLNTSAETPSGRGEREHVGEHQQHRRDERAQQQHQHHEDDQQDRRDDHPQVALAGVPDVEVGSRCCRRPGRPCRPCRARVRSRVTTSSAARAVGRRRVSVACTSTLPSTTFGGAPRRRPRPTAAVRHAGDPASRPGHDGVGLGPGATTISTGLPEPRREVPGEDLLAGDRVDLVRNRSVCGDAVGLERRHERRRSASEREQR